MISRVFSATNWILILVVCVAVSAWGCSQSNMQRALPAPVREPIEVSLRGRIFRWWGGDNFEFGDHRELHYILVQGIRSPPPSSRYFEESKGMTIKLTRYRRVTIEVVDRDPLMREIARVWVPQREGKPKGEDWDDPATEAELQEQYDLGLKLIQLGWAEYNGADFAEAEAYQMAEQQARAAKLGIWAEDPDPSDAKDSGESEDRNAANPDSSISDSLDARRF